MGSSPTARTTKAGASGGRARDLKPRFLRVFGRPHDKLPNVLRRMSDQISIEREPSEDAGVVLRLVGDLTIHTVTDAHNALENIESSECGVIDLAGVRRLDTSGAWLLVDLETRTAAAGRGIKLRDAADKSSLLLDSVRDAYPEKETAIVHATSLPERLETIGRGVASAVDFVLQLHGFLGLFLAGLARTIRHPRDFRLTSLVSHCEDVGLRAVPIVSLMAFLIGVVLAFQGSAQLRQFGAEVFVVDLISISILRELGILLTAIIVAGRTASSYTAAIGSMKMREEIDAMRALGLDPVTVLFVPRILALLLMLPILGLIANVMGLLGGAIMSWIELGISPSMFRTRMIEGTDVSHVLAGLKHRL